MEIYKKQTLSETFKFYFDKRMIKILLLGSISGFPWVIIGSSLSLWLKEDDIKYNWLGRFNICRICFQLFMGTDNR